MKGVAALVPSYYGLARDPLPGAHSCVVTGCSNVTLARNLVLSKGLEAPPSVDVFVLLDDDIVFEAKDVIALVRQARHSRRLVCGLYMLSAETPAWYLHLSAGRIAGLGFAAVSRRVLANYAGSLPRFWTRNGEPFYPFCQTGLWKGEWLTEDAWLCAMLGVELAPVAAVHRKETDLMVPSEAVEAVRKGVGG